MPVPFQIGGTSGAIRVNASAPYTVPANMAIYSIVPQPSWTGKAIALASKGYAHLTSDRTETGAAVAASTSPIYGAYTSLTTTAGEADIYLRPANEV